MMVTPNTRGRMRALQERGRLMDKLYAEVIREHGPREGRKLITRALRSTLSDMTGELKGATPRKSGKLKRAAKVQPVKGKKGFIYGARFGYIGYRWFAAALALEFGNRWRRERAPIRKTYRRHRDTITARIASAFRDHVEAFARKASRRVTAATRRASRGEG